MLLLCRLKVLLTRQNLALEDKNLNTDKTIRCHCLGESVIDIGAECVQRHPAFTIPFGSRHLCPAKTTGTGNSDALCPELERRCNALLHGTAECNPAFQL